MRIDIITIFPDLVEHYAASALIGRARTAGLLDLRVHDLRSAATDARRSVDDAPFGGGPGMVLCAAPILSLVDAVDPCRPLFLLGPGGRRLDQSLVRCLASGEASSVVGPGRTRRDPSSTPGTGCGGFSLLCGRYEGVDQRVLDHVVDGEISVGDYVLAGGELAALVVVEAVTRLLPGAMGNEGSVDEESFTHGLLEYPQYTRPAELRGWSVPPVLLSGDHGRVARWRRAMALRRTLEHRPDLIVARGGLEPDEVTLLEELERDSDSDSDSTGDGDGDGGGTGPGPEA